MKNFRIIALIMAASMISLHVTAQEKIKRAKQISVENAGKVQIESTAGAGGIPGGTAYRLHGAEGTPYLYDQWKAGEMMLKSKHLLGDRVFRYDIYARQMQFIYGEDTVALANPEEVEWVNFQGHHFVYRTYQSGTQEMSDWFELLVDGDCSLLLRRKVLYHMASEEQSGEADAKDKFYMVRDYYANIEGSKFFKLDCTNREICKSFCDKKDEIKAFIKGRKLNVKRQEDLEAVIAYYNSLL